MTNDELENLYLAIVAEHSSEPDPYTKAAVLLARHVESTQLRPFAVRRPHYSPQGGVIIARSAKEAIWLSNRAYGYAGNTTADEYQGD